MIAKEFDLTGAEAFQISGGVEGVDSDARCTSQNRSTQDLASCKAHIALRCDDRMGFRIGRKIEIGNRFVFSRS
jgi:hypothetical protein